MNKWKIGFWCSLLVLLMTCILFIYKIRDKDYTIMWQNTVYYDWKNDLDNLTIILNESDLTRASIKNALSKHKTVNHIDFSKDTIYFETINLVLSNDKLVKVIDY